MTTTTLADLAYVMLCELEAHPLVDPMNDAQARSIADVLADDVHPEMRKEHVSMLQLITCDAENSVIRQLGYKMYQAYSGRF